MDSDDPELEAFESNLRAIIRARELGKTEHQCPIFAQKHQTLNWSVNLIPLQHIISLPV